MNNKKKVIYLIVAAVLIVASALYISVYWYQLLLIQGDSMSPTYKNLQLVVIDKHNGDYTYGDVIACRKGKTVLVKRIVGMPGDELYTESGNLYVNDKKSELVAGNIGYEGVLSKGIALQHDEFFVMGDNYAESRDSRYEDIGNIKVENIIGKLVFPK